jgi:hypothetical protein
MLRRIGVGFLIALVSGLAIYPAGPAAQARALTVAPALVGFAPTSAPLRAVAVQGGYAYVLGQTQTQLDVFAIVDPAMPQLAGTYTATSAITDIVLTPSHLYVATAGDGLRVLSLADPAHPAEVGAFTLFPEATSLTLGPGYLLLTAGVSGLRVLSLADPAHPAEVGAIVWVNSVTSQTWLAYDAVLSGRYAYVSASNLRSGIYRQVFIVDLLDPAHPIHVAQSELRVDIETLLEVRDGYGYLGSFLGELMVLDLRVPTAITVSGSIDLEAPVQAGVLFGRYAYVGVEDGLRVVDVSDPTAPAPAGAALDGISVHDLALRGSYLYVAGQNGLSILTLGVALDQRVYLPAVYAAGG